MKLKLASLNLIISLTIILAFLSYAWFFWHPHSFSTLTGFNRSAGVMILVNICLGPLLIFIIYKKNKNNLTFDLFALASIQIAAFILGAYSIYLKDPVYTVFTVDRFTLINPKLATPLNAISDEFKVSGLYKPKFAFAKMPSDRTTRNNIMMEVVFNGKPDYDERAEYYEPLNQHITHVLNKTLDPEIIFSNIQTKPKLLKFLNRYGGNENDYAYFPLQGGAKDVVLVLSKSEGKIIDIIDSDPWITDNLAYSNQSNNLLFQ